MTPKQYSLALKKAADPSAGANERASIYRMLADKVLRNPKLRPAASDASDNAGDTSTVYPGVSIGLDKDGTKRKLTAVIEYDGTASGLVAVGFAVGAIWNAVRTG